MFPHEHEVWVHTENPIESSCEIAPRTGLYERLFDFCMGNAVMEAGHQGASAMAKRVALYLRVSTKGQSVENQRRELEAVAKRSGWRIVETYKDAGISGAKGRDKRPGFDRLLKDATRRKFDMIAAWSVDRLGRSL